MLAWGGQRTGQPTAALRSPTTRRPGSSVAALAEAATLGGAQGTPAAAAAAAPPRPRLGQPRAAQPLPPQPPPLGGLAPSAGEVGTSAGAAGGPAAARPDADGFVEVVRRGRRRGPEQVGLGAAGGAAAASAPVADDETGDWNDMDDDGWEDDGPIHHAEGQGAHGDEEQEQEEPQLDPATLKRAWDREAATVRMLERDGMPADHPVLRAAVAARDDAERAYRDRRSPHPVARRMGWAQSRLDKAVAREGKTREELLAFERDMAWRRKRIMDRLDLDVERVSKRRQELAELQEEAGAEAPSVARLAEEGKAACGRAAGGLRNAAPRALALVESLPEGSPARGEANLLVSQLADLQRELELAARAEAGPEAFDIADAASDSEWSESHEVPAGGAASGGGGGNSGGTGTATWQAESFGRWQRGKPPQPTSPSSSAHQGKGVGGMASVLGGGKAPAPAASAADAPARQGPATSANGGSMVGPQGGEEGDERAPKHRRGQGDADNASAAAAASDARRAAELYQQQCIAQSAGFATEAAQQMAGQLHARRVAEVVAMAVELKVQPITEDGQDLIVLGPEDLAAWEAKHLRPAQAR